MLTRRPERAQWRSPFDWFFDEILPERGWLGSRGSTPSIDMREKDDAFVIDAEMPGVKPEDVDVTLDGRNLIIQGRYGQEQEEDGREGQYLLRERQSGVFARAITLPTDVDADAVQCSFQNGELTLTLPKSAQARSRRIPVSSGSAKQVGPGSEQEQQQGAAGSGQQGARGSTG
jgi:HSP20 family protein